MTEDSTSTLSEGKRQIIKTQAALELAEKLYDLGLRKFGISYGNITAHIDEIPDDILIWISKNWGKPYAFGSSVCYWKEETTVTPSITIMEKPKPKPTPEEHPLLQRIQRITVPGPE